MEYKPHTADLIFYKRRSLLGRLILYFTRSPGEEKSYASHVAGLISPDILLESVLTTIKRPFDITKESRLEIYRYTGPIPTNDFVDLVAKKANEYHGKTYGFGKVITHFLDAILVKMFKKEIYFFRKINHFHRYPICSWVWAYAYNRALSGYEFGVEPKYTTPDDMHDFVKESIEWELVYKG